MKENTTNPLLPERETMKDKLQALEDAWENCKGQCGFTPWCRECMLEKERLLEEKLNREGRPVDKED